MQSPDSYDLVIIGSGFGSSFFLHKALRRLPASARILVLERGGMFTHDWQIANGRNSDIESERTIRTAPGEKPWRFTIGFGGGTNCWWGVTPRMHPTDFQLRTRYGVGRDWPLSYDELEPFYGEAEAIMEVSGDPDIGQLFPRSTPFAQPPHRLTAADHLMKRARPDLHYVLPTARSRIPTLRRGACCASSTCGLCPNDAKFTANNGFRDTYDDPRVTVRTRAEVVALDASGGAVRSAIYRQDGQEFVARGDLFVLGANALFSPVILQRSGLATPHTGRGLHEQVGATVEVFLDGLDHFDGSTATTGVNYGLFDGAHRSTASGVMVLFRNYWWDGLRTEPGRWRQTLPLLLVAEDLPDEANRVDAALDGGPPHVSHPGRSAYARKGIERALGKLPELLSPLPVERIEFRRWRSSESHIQGTLRMGADLQDSVVDRDLVHHTLRNLVVVGTAVFPSCSCANPSLTAAALSLRAASRIL
ncbi:MAG TPA: GMC family oxidoreductase [Alphaproteobacteria bacterium]|nr:GMC family oxidoreductase [Alphaproteobacteria bacterium]